MKPHSSLDSSNDPDHGKPDHITVFKLCTAFLRTFELQILYSMARKLTYKTPKESVNRITAKESQIISDENKNQRLEIRLTKVQKEVIAQASAASGFKNVSDYILHLAITDSRNVIRDQQLLELSERDRKSFMKAIDDAPEPGKNLKKALANYAALQLKVK